MPRPTLLAVSHGTSDPDGARSVAALVAALARALPGVDVREAFVDVQRPDAAELAATIAGPLVIVPLLLSRGYHVHHDLHGIARARPRTAIAAPMGPDDRIAEVLAARLPDDDRSVVLAAAGSRDPLSVPDAEGMAGLLARRLGREVHLGYLAAREPSLPATLAEHPDAVVSAYLLGRGFFFDLAARLVAGRELSPPLLDDDPPPRPLVGLLADRYLAAAERV